MEYLVLGLLPEALYFPIMMILIRNLKKHRIKLTVSMLLSYIIMINVMPYELMFNFLYFFAAYWILKFCYKKKIQITDIFLMAFYSIIIIISSAIGYYVSYLTIQSLSFASIIRTIIMYLFLFATKNCISRIYILYYKNWNRRPDLKVKSLTVRCISIVVFNFMLALIGYLFLYKDFIINLGVR